MNKKTTDDKIDELAIMIAKGFDGVDKRFDQTATKEDLREVKDGLQTLENKVDIIDKNVKEINMKIYDLDETVRRHSRRIEKLEENASIL